MSNNFPNLSLVANNNLVLLSHNSASTRWMAISFGNTARRASSYVELFLTIWQLQDPLLQTLTAECHNQSIGGQNYCIWLRVSFWRNLSAQLGNANNEAMFLLKEIWLWRNLNESWELLFCIPINSTYKTTSCSSFSLNLTLPIGILRLCQSSTLLISSSWTREDMALSACVVFFGILDEQAMRFFGGLTVSSRWMARNKSFLGTTLQINQHCHALTIQQSQVDSPTEFFRVFIFKSLDRSLVWSIKVRLSWTLLSNKWSEIVA